MIHADETLRTVRLLLRGVSVQIARPWGCGEIVDAVIELLELRGVSVMTWRELAAAPGEPGDRARRNGLVRRADQLAAAWRRSGASVLVVEDVEELGADAAELDEVTRREHITTVMTVTLVDGVAPTSLPGRGRGYVRVQLARLTYADTLELVKTMLPGHRRDGSLIEVASEVFRATGGVVALAEAMLRGLLLEESLTTAGGTWRIGDARWWSHVEPVADEALVFLRRAGPASACDACPVSWMRDAGRPNVRSQAGPAGLDGGLATFPACEGCLADEFVPPILVDHLRSRYLRRFRSAAEGSSWRVTMSDRSGGRRVGRALRDIDVACVDALDEGLRPTSADRGGGGGGVGGGRSAWAGGLPSPPVRGDAIVGPVGGGVASPATGLFRRYLGWARREDAAEVAGLAEGVPSEEWQIRDGLWEGVGRLAGADPAASAGSGWGASSAESSLSSSPEAVRRLARRDGEGAIRVGLRDVADAFRSLDGSRVLVDCYVAALVLFWAGEGRLHMGLVERVLHAYPALDRTSPFWSGFLNLATFVAFAEGEWPSLAAVADVRGGSGGSGDPRTGVPWASALDTELAISLAGDDVAGAAALLARMADDARSAAPRLAEVEDELRRVEEGTSPAGFLALVLEVVRRRAFERPSRDELDAVLVLHRRFRGRYPDALCSREKLGAGRVDALTPREVEIGLLSECRSTREIASLLGLSIRTVDNHLAAAFRKTGLSSRVELSTAISWSHLAGVPRCDRTAGREREP